MSTVIDCDEGFVTSIASEEESLHHIKKSKVNIVEEKEKEDKNCCKQCLSLKSQNRYLSEENLSLKELNKELHEMDQKRQKYDLERQDYILRLLKTIKKLQLRSSRMISSDSESESLNDRQKVLQMSSSKSQTEAKEQNEKSLLEQSYERAIKENINSQKELDELRTNFDNLIEQLGKIESEHIQVLEFQARVHKEDYECEKRDKEIALNEVKKMSSENERMTKICKNYEKKIQKFVHIFQKTDLLSNNDLKHSSSLTKIGINSEQIKTNSLPNEFRSKTNKSIEINKIKNNNHSNSKVCELDDVIECPNCQILFPIRFHEQLLQHFEKCQIND